jgi:hypothetical protein
VDGFIHINIYVDVAHMNGVVLWSDGKWSTDVCVLPFCMLVGWCWVLGLWVCLTWFAKGLELISQEGPPGRCPLSLLVHIVAL